MLKIGQQLIEYAQQEQTRRNGTDRRQRKYFILYDTFYALFQAIP